MFPRSDLMFLSKAAPQLKCRAYCALESYHALKFRHKRTVRLGQRNHREAKLFC
jgi:hypothetical protein